MQVAGAIGWTPTVFWAATPKELWAMFAGWQHANCPGKDKPDPVSPEGMAAAAESAPEHVGSIRRYVGARRGMPG